MAAYAALVSLMNNIEQMMKHPFVSTCLDNNYIQPLFEKAAFLLDYIEDCYHHGGGNREAADALERRITSAAHAAEDVIESHIVDQIHAGISEVSLACSLELQRITQDIDAIITNATEEKQRWRKEKSIHNAVPKVESGETAMVGLKDELHQLLDELTGEQSKRLIFSIVGMGGTGKTTLAKSLYEHGLIKEHFDVHAWVTISQQYNAEDIISKLLSSIGDSTSGTLGERLHKTLYGRRYLIVLDDIWSVEAWEELSCFFPDNGNRSRVVLTTRLAKVAKDCGSSCLNLGLLDEDKSWNLFCGKALFPQKNDPPQLEDVGKKIVRSCKGLALSISVIGGLLLKSSRTVDYWKSVKRYMKSISGSKEKHEMLDVLSLSYSHLPPHLKPCFLYMGVFEEDSEIKVSNLIQLWVGEGFLKPSESMEMEEVAEGYIDDLIDRNLIVAGRRGSNGKIRFCGIHDLLRDVSIKIAEEQEFVRYWHKELRGVEERHIVCNYSFSNDIKVPLARSMIGCCRPNGSKLLRVLNTTKHDFILGEVFCACVNMRYIAVKYVEFLVVPNSIFHVWNLQTLIVRYSTLVVAPHEFWKMQQLRHVHCEGIYLPHRVLGEEEEVVVMLKNLLKTPMKCFNVCNRIPNIKKLVILEKFQTLKTAVNLRLCEEVCKIIPNIKKLHLKYSESHHGYDKSNIKGLSNLNLLHKLESLKLMCEYRDFNYGLREIVRFPNSLKKLSLEGCMLDWELDMTKIGSLPQLEVLNLGCNAFYKYWTPVDGEFLHLKVLRIEFCSSLRVWNADCSHFPALNKLLLRGLDDLKEIPSGIGEIPTLQLIRVDECGVSAPVSAIKIKEKRLDFDDDDDLQIQVILYKLHLERFKEVMETEELTTNNIQFQVT